MLWASLGNQGKGGGDQSQKKSTRLFPTMKTADMFHRGLSLGWFSSIQEMGDMEG